MPEPLWPKYKGNRKYNWDCETPVEVFNQIRDKVAERIARLTSGKVVAFKGAEADDIAAVVATYEKHSVLLLSGDGDWRQLLLRGDHVSLHNLYSGLHEASTAELRVEILHSLKVKVVGGDSGDNVKGIPRLDRKGRKCLAKDGAAKLLGENPEIDAKAMLDPLYLRKNTCMMCLDKRAIPPYIWAGVEAGLKAEKTYTTEPMCWADLGLSDRERERLDVAGGSAMIFRQWVTTPAQTAGTL